MHQVRVDPATTLGPPPCILSARMVVVSTETCGFEPAEPAFYVPEFFKADIGSKAALGDMVVEHLETDAVGDDGGLSHGDIGKGAGMHHAGLVFGRAASAWD